MLDAATHRIRRGLARRADKLLGALRLVEPRPAPASPAPARPIGRAAAPASRPARPEAKVEQTPRSAPEAPAAPEVPFAAAGPTRAPSREVPEPAPQPEPLPAAPADAAPAGPGLDRAEVQEILDDMVRPALQADGGDITLVRVDGGDVYVRLVGACSSCPSSTLTMKMGIERLLEEELAGFQRLIQVGDLPNDGSAVGPAF